MFVGACSLIVDQETEKDNSSDSDSTLLRKIADDHKLNNKLESFVTAYNKIHRKDTESVSDKTDRSITESEILSSDPDKDSNGNLHGSVIADKKEKKVP